MADVAKVFMSGESQAVRLPEAYRFECDEVEVSREGDAVVLRPRKAERPWARLTAALAAMDEISFGDELAANLERSPPQERPELDDFFRDR